MTLAAPSAVFQPNMLIEADPIQAIAKQITKLSYRDMVRLAGEIHDINLKHSSFSFAEGLNDWAEQRTLVSNVIAMGR